MAVSPEITAAERELNTARSTLNVARLALSSSLAKLAAPEDATERLLKFAGEHGIDHALEVLASKPTSLKLPQIPKPVLENISKQLEATHEAGHRIDIALAKREALAPQAKAGNKTINVLGKDYEFDPKAGTLHDKASGAIIPSDHKVIEPSADTGSETDTERDR